MVFGLSHLPLGGPDRPRAPTRCRSGCGRALSGSSGLTAAALAPHPSTKAVSEPSSYHVLVAFQCFSCCLLAERRLFQAPKAFGAPASWPWPALARPVVSPRPGFDRCDGLARAARPSKSSALRVITPILKGNHDVKWRGNPSVHSTSSKALIL